MLQDEKEIISAFLSVFFLALDRITDHAIQLSPADLITSSEAAGSCISNTDSETFNKEC